MRSERFFFVSHSLLLATALLCLCCNFLHAESPRSKLSLDFDSWFHLGDVVGGEASDVGDRKWQHLDVPHDWSIEREYREDNPAGMAGGYCRRPAQVVFPSPYSRRDRCGMEA